MVSALCQRLSTLLVPQGLPKPLEGPSVQHPFACANHFQKACHRRLQWLQLMDSMTTYSFRLAFSSCWRVRSLYPTQYEAMSYRLTALRTGPKVWSTRARVIPSTVMSTST